MKRAEQIIAQFTGRTDLERQPQPKTDSRYAPPAPVYCAAGTCYCAPTTRQVLADGFDWTLAGHHDNRRVWQSA